MEHGFLYEVGIFLMFFTGQVVHAWLRAQASIHSKLSGINTYRDYAKFHAPSLAYRFFLLPISQVDIRCRLVPLSPVFTGLLRIPSSTEPQTSCPGNTLP